MSGSNGGNARGDPAPGLRNISDVPQLGRKDLNDIRLVAPTGVDPVFGHGHVFASSLA